MIFQRTSRRVLFICHKYNFTSKNFTSRFSSLRALFKEKIKYSRLSNSIFASTALFGLTVYIIYKKNAFCETVDIDCQDPESNIKSDQSYEEAIRKSRDILQRLKDECGAPGIVVGVSVNGRTVWNEGLGYSDLENRVLCSADTVMRIASISKSITMAAVAKLWEQGKLDLDKPIQNYVPYFPVKTFDGKPVTITCRQLVSHLSGIRHYEKIKSGEDKSKKNEKSEFDNKEYYIKEHYKDVKTSLDIFKDDPLVANPGSKFLYSTHGWTLISAVIEAASKEQFSTHITKLFKSLGMHNTYLDVQDALIYHRSGNYIKNKNGYLINAPYVDNSYKWAGGGFLSTVGDLLQFGNAMLYSLQYKPIIETSNNETNSLENEQNIKIHNINCNVSDVKGNVSSKEILPGYLKSKTVEAMWTPVTNAKEGKYGMGWSVLPEVNECQFCESKQFCVYHTGGAIGASSVLLILPHSTNEFNDLNQTPPPKGIIVTILTNLHSIPLSKTALKIAHIFDNESKQF